MNSFLFISALFFNHTALAFDDPQNLMPRLEAFLGKTSFAEAFRAGDNFVLDSTNCLAQNSQCDTMGFRYVVATADAEMATVSTYIGTRTQPSNIAKIRRADWDALNGNLARNRIMQIESYGLRVRLVSLQDTTVQIVVNGKLSMYPAMELAIEGVNQTGFSVHEVLGLSNAIRGPGQLVRRLSTGQTQAGGETDISLKEFTSLN